MTRRSAAAYVLWRKAGCNPTTARCLCIVSSPEADQGSALRAELESRLEFGHDPGLAIQHFTIPIDRVPAAREVGPLPIQPIPVNRCNRLQEKFTPGESWI